jgi:Xaa-Pro aminopeptidase
LTTDASAGRLHSIRRLLSRFKCTHILVSDVVDVEYISQFKSSSVFLLISRKEALLCTDFRYRHVANVFVKQHPAWRFIETSGQTFTFLSDYLPKGSTLGIQSESMTLDTFDALTKSCPDTVFVKLKTALSDISIIKTNDEIRSMKRAGAIGVSAYKKLLKWIRPGVSEYESAQKLESFCSEGGSEKPAFETIVLFGKNAALPHGHPSSKKLKTGEWILCDFGCTVDGLCSDMTRTAILGKATDAQRALYTIVQDAQAAGVKAVKAGVRAHMVDIMTRQMITEAGYGELFGHGTGHGVGRRIHESPRLNKKDKTILAENMVVTVEPGIYQSDIGGIRIEDMVVVTKQGCMNLTNCPHRLIELRACYEISVAT